MARKKPEDLRSHRWLGVDDMRAFGHRSRLRQIGYDQSDWTGKPVIGIINTWSDINPCHAHFPERVQWIKKGVLQAGGFPLELPALSLSIPARVGAGPGDDLHRAVWLRRGDTRKQLLHRHSRPLGWAWPAHHGLRWAPTCSGDARVLVRHGESFLHEVPWYQGSSREFSPIFSVRPFSEFDFACAFNDVRANSL
jgi:hypothetical protein